MIPCRLNDSCEDRLGRWNPLLWSASCRGGCPDRRPLRRRPAAGRWAAYGGGARPCRSNASRRGRSRCAGLVPRHAESTRRGSLACERSRAGRYLFAARGLRQRCRRHSQPASRSPPTACDRAGCQPATQCTDAKSRRVADAAAAPEPCALARGPGESGGAARGPGSTSYAPQHPAAGSASPCGRGGPACSNACTGLAGPRCADAPYDSCPAQPGPALDAALALPRILADAAGAQAAGAAARARPIDPRESGRAAQILVPCSAVRSAAIITSLCLFTA